MWPAPARRRRYERQKAQKPNASVTTSAGGTNILGSLYCSQSVAFRESFHEMYFFFFSFLFSSAGVVVVVVVVKGADRCGGASASEADAPPGSVGLFGAEEDVGLLLLVLLLLLPMLSDGGGEDQRPHPIFFLAGMCVCVCKSSDRARGEEGGSIDGSRLRIG